MFDRLRRAKKSIAALVIIALASACSGTPNTPNGPVVGSPGGGGPSPIKLVDVKVTVTIPNASKGVRSDYLSSNTASLAITLVSVNGDGVSGVNPTVMDTLRNSRDCQAHAQGTVCTKTAEGSPGKDVFAVTTYSNVGATGDVLSVGAVRATIASGGGSVGITNRIPLTLEGVIASLRLSLTPNKAKRGDQTTANVTLNAYDASGAEIVGPSDYSQPIALTIQGDSNKSFELHDGDRSGQTLSIRKPSSGITLAYDGSKQASPISVQASVAGPSGISANANFDLSGKQPPPPVGMIYALNLGSKSGQGAVVTEYDGKAKENAAPKRVLALDAKLYAVSMAVDSKGNLYIGYFDSALGESNGKPDSGNEIAIYAPGSSGNDKPQATLVADASSNTTLFPIFIAFDPKGRLVTYGATTVDNNAGDAVLTYSAGSSGPVAPEDGFAFKSPTLNYGGPTGLAIDASNNVYLNGAFKEGFGNAYGLFVASAADIGNPSATPSRTIPWDNTTKLTPGQTTDAVLDKSGEIFIANFVKSGSGSGANCQAMVNVFAGGAGGGTTDKKPLRTMTLDGIVTHGTDCTNGFNPLLFYFPEITVYGSDLFAADAYDDAIDAFSASAHGISKPLLHIAGSATQLDGPVALVITSVSGRAKAGPVAGAGAPEPPLTQQNAP